MQALPQLPEVCEIGYTSFAIPPAAIVTILRSGASAICTAALPRWRDFALVFSGGGKKAGEVDEGKRGQEFAPLQQATLQRTGFFPVNLPLVPRESRGEREILHVLARAASGAAARYI